MGRNSKKPYIICQNATCKPFGNSTRSWRFLEGLKKGDCCKYCNEEFKFDVSDDGGWRKQNSKGRARPAPPPSSSTPAPDDTVLRELAEARLNDIQDEQEKERIRQVLFPVKPKTEEDVLKDAIARVEKANSMARHEASQVASMEKSLHDRSEALLAYSVRVDERKASLLQAQNELTAAQKDLADLQISKAPVAPQPINPDQIKSAVDIQPLQIGQVLAGVSGIPSMNQETIDNIQNALAQWMQLRMGQALSALSTVRGAAVSASAPAVGITAAGFVPDLGQQQGQLQQQQQQQLQQQQQQPQQYSPLY